MLPPTLVLKAVVAPTVPPLFGRLFAPDRVLDVSVDAVERGLVRAARSGLGLRRLQGVAGRGGLRLLLLQRTLGSLQLALRGVQVVDGGGDVAGGDGGVLGANGRGVHIRREHLGDLVAAAPAVGVVTDGLGTELALVLGHLGLVLGHLGLIGGDLTVQLGQLVVGART